MFVKFLRSVPLALFMMLLLLVLFVTGTLKADYAIQMFYNTLWFKTILWIFIFLTTFCILRKSNFRKAKLGALFTHLSILIIAIGGLVTLESRQKGAVMLLEKQQNPSKEFVSEKSFYVKLNNNPVSKTVEADMNNWKSDKHLSIKIKKNKNTHKSNKKNDDAKQVEASKKDEAKSPKVENKKEENKKKSPHSSSNPHSKHKNYLNIPKDYTLTKFEFQKEIKTVKGRTKRVLIIKNLDTNVEKNVFLIPGIEKNITNSLSVKMINMPGGNSHNKKHINKPSIDETWELIFTIKQSIPFGFTLALDKFKIDRYGGDEYVSVRDNETGEEYIFDMDDTEFNKKYPIGETGYAFEIAGFYPDFKVGGMGGSSGLSNPSLNINLYPPESTEEKPINKYIFADYKGDFLHSMGGMHDKETKLPFEINYNYGEPNAGIKQYTSHIVINDNGEIIKGEVSVNNPYRYKGFTFYQLSYKYLSPSGIKWMTILEVSRDRGYPIVYFGYLIFMLANILLFLRKQKKVKATVQ